jgi:hypothetical protein
VNILEGSELPQFLIASGKLQLKVCIGEYTITSPPGVYSKGSVRWDHMVSE